MSAVVISEEPSVFKSMIETQCRFTSPGTLMMQMHIK